jgi:3',5'-cyclic AMP phosphodiesterase CpdA
MLKKAEINMSEITILHLSDLHFRKKEKEGHQALRREIGRQMIAGIKEHLNKFNQELDFVVITGDIAFDGKDYTEAEKFFADLKLILPSTVVFLPIPGNHDVNRDETDDVSSLYPVVQKGEADQFLENPKKIEKYVNVKFAFYRKFAAKLNEELYASPQEYFWVKDFTERNVSFIGLNSCWACQGDEDRGKIALGPAQVLRALEQSKLNNRIILMHHPLYEWFHEGDRRACQPLIFQNCRLVLHGHSHIAEAAYYGAPGSGSLCLCANASYTKNNDGYIGFQFLKARFAEEVYVTLWPYKYDELNRNIIPDRNRWGEAQQGREYFDIATVPMNSQPEVKKLKSPAEIIRDYKDWFNEFHSTVSFDQLAKKGEALPGKWWPIISPGIKPFYFLTVWMKPRRPGGTTWRI